MQNSKCKIKGRKRRRVWYVCLAVFAAVCIITSFVRAESVEYATREVVVEEGDTLWGIWEEVGCGNYHKWKYEVQKMNGMETADIMAYQKLVVPVVK